MPADTVNQTDDNVVITIPISYDWNSAVSEIRGVIEAITDGSVSTTRNKKNRTVEMESHSELKGHLERLCIKRQWGIE